MSTEIDEIKNTLKTKVLYEGLELNELGIALSDITDDVAIIGDEGLALDSVDALEILSLLYRHFGIDVANPSKQLFEEHLASFDKLLAFVVSHKLQVAA